MATFLDTTALIDSTSAASPRHDWCIEALDQARLEGPLLITDVVFSEFSVGMESLEATNEAVALLALERYAFSDEALFRAGRAYRQYRIEHGGIKSNVLPDFLIGAQAEVSGAPLISANPGDFLTYFPELQVISP